MKIFLDVTREFPDKKYGFNCVRDYNTCIMLIDAFRNELDFISLDYDINDEYTGLDVLKYIKENKIAPNNINIHSTHSIGREKMYKFAKENFANCRITMKKRGFIQPLFKIGIVNL
jgi:hypothetical protein